MASQNSRNTTCSANFTPCGPGSSRCQSGDICNFKRGIPACEDLSLSLYSNFGGQPCNDPYLFSCNIPEMDGVCCPIGTVCFYYTAQNFISCIDAVGVTATSYPSTATGFLPVSTPATTESDSIIFSPLTAWKKTTDPPSCSSSSATWTTSQLNASISFNFSGPSVMVHTVTSSDGGVFSVILDGLNTTTTIDTYSGGQLVLPQCMPSQFPPFHMVPPTLANETEHTITLVYIGASPNAGSETGTQVNIQFDSFALPIFLVDGQSSGADKPVTERHVKLKG
ncbi:hypothetical protein B0H11DRAFT_2177118 [Mycena galericulata]|nr:hypothetical protein B0H11DRAFT_2177118 [Mycena galericulata]